MENENKTLQCDIQDSQYIGRFADGDLQSPNYAEETLYVTKEGNPFLCTKDDGCSRFAKRSDYEIAYPGYKIIPICWDEAMEWAERHLDEIEYGTAYQAYELYD